MRALPLPLSPCSGGGQQGCAPRRDCASCHSKGHDGGPCCPIQEVEGSVSLPRLRLSGEGPCSGDIRTRQRAQADLQWGSPPRLPSGSLLDPCVDTMTLSQDVSASATLRRTMSYGAGPLASSAVGNWALRQRTEE